jgi:hypothetical protein
MSTTNSDQLIEQINARFQSGNSVSVERAHITADEWSGIRAALSAPPAVKEGELIAAAKRVLSNADSEPDEDYLEGAAPGSVAVHRNHIERLRAAVLSAPTEKGGGEEVARITKLYQIACVDCAKAESEVKRLKENLQVTEAQVGLCHETIDSLRTALAEMRALAEQREKAQGALDAIFDALMLFSPPEKAPLSPLHKTLEMLKEHRDMRERLAQLTSSLPVAGVPDILFDGHAVFKGLDEKAMRRTSPENVSDVLDAVVRILRGQGLAAPKSVASGAQGVAEE